MKLLVLALLSFITVAYSQSCTLHDNTDYNSGYLVMLYDVKSAQDCCSACSTFEECTYFSYVKAQSAGEWYQRCFIKNSGTNQIPNNATTAGPIGRTPPPPPQPCTVEDNTDYDNGWLTLIEKVPSSDICCDLCRHYPGCKAWSWIKDTTAGAWYQRCFFKGAASNKKTNAGTVAGVMTSNINPPPARTGKRGLAWFNSKSCSDLKLMKSVSWFYNWAPTPDQEMVNCFLELGIEYIPMQWGGGGLPDLNQTIYSGAKHLFTFNEPNFHAQANVLPADAAKMWPTLTAIAQEHGMKLGSPAAAACGPTAADCYAGSWDPSPWFDAFFGNCTGCHVDFLTTHIYTCDINQFTTFLNNLKKYKLPIWLTEFACPAAKQPESVEIAFMKAALNYLDNDPMIEKYAWFGTRLDPTDGWLGPQVDLIDDSTCALSDLGKVYNP